jgi:hypothetical protein
MVMAHQMQETPHPTTACSVPPGHLPDAPTTASVTYNDSLLCCNQYGCPGRMPGLLDFKHFVRLASTHAWNTRVQAYFLAPNTVVNQAGKCFSLFPMRRRERRGCW